MQTRSSPDISHRNAITRTKNEQPDTEVTTGATHT